MTRTNVLGIAICCFIATHAVNAFALTTVTSKLYAFAQAYSNNDAHFVQFQSTVTGCTSNRAYIAFEDKEVFAAALTGAAQGLTVNALVDIAAAGVSMDTHGPNPMTCRIISLWIAGY